MTRYSRPLHDLHDKLLTWRRVADACDGPRDLPRGSYYRSIAMGQIRRPSALARRGIANAYNKHCADGVIGCYITLERPRRFPMVVDRPLGQSINEWRKTHCLTWDQWAALADALMRREFGDCCANLPIVAYSCNVQRAGRRWHQGTIYCTRLQLPAMP